MTDHREETGVPLVVDVDGTLVSGDLLLEGMVRLPAESPLSLVHISLVVHAARARVGPDVR